MEKTDDAFLTSSLTSLNQGQGLLNQLILLGWPTFYRPACAKGQPFPNAYYIYHSSAVSFHVHHFYPSAPKAWGIFVEGEGRVS